MHAWQFTGTHEPPLLTEVPEPTVAPDGVVLDVKAVGLCHSDVGLLEDPGWLALVRTPPTVMGHEVAGVVAEVGANVTDWKVGDRVGVCPTTRVGAPGHHYDGGLASKVAVDQVALVRMPDDVSFVHGAAGVDAGMTSYHAVVANGGVTTGTKVGIIGFGGLGQIGARVAVLSGAEVYVAEINQDAWDNVRAAGVHQVAPSIRDFADVGLDVVVDFAGFGVTTADAIEVVGQGGKVVQVGMGKLEALINTRDLIIKAVTLIGSVGGTKEDVAGVYDYFATGKLDPAITEIAFDDVADGLAQLAAGKVVGRLVVSSGF